MSSLVLESVILIRLATEAVLLESTRSGSATNFTHSLKKRAARNTVTHCSHCALCHSRVSLKTLRTCTQSLLRLDCRTACAQELTINFRFRCVSYQAAKCMKHNGLQKNSIDDSTSRLRSTMSKKSERQTHWESNLPWRACRANVNAARPTKDISETCVYMYLL